MRTRKVNFSELENNMKREERRNILGGGANKLDQLGPSDDTDFDYSSGGSGFGMTGFGQGPFVSGSANNFSQLGSYGSSSYNNSSYTGGSYGGGSYGGSSSGSNYNAGWSFTNNGLTTNDPYAIDRYLTFAFKNNGMLSGDQALTFILNETTLAGQQQNNIQLYGTILDNVNVQNNYKGPSTIPIGTVIDNVTLFINNSGVTSDTYSNGASTPTSLGMAIHGSAFKPTALEAAYLSKAVYGDAVTEKDLNGWEVSKIATGLSYNNLGSGFRSQLYEKTINGKKQYCYVTAGTESSVADVAADVIQQAGISLQYQESVNNAKALKALFGDALSFAGHSLGGGLAEANARATGESATTFNAAGLSYSTAIVLGIGFISDTNAYIMTTDPLNALQSSSLLLPTAGGEKHFLSPTNTAGTINGHSIDSVIESLKKNP
ncbi:hypothetical protein [Flavobacterium sp. FlaQc-30]|uniref:hypothetical protein n=1 Tax=Flavobacterium sp. FlaQc-30 TaxID=3374179 RepID=UPI003756E4A2